MKIKSIKNFRWYYKTRIRRRNDRNTNTNFVGVYHDIGDKRINGYFELSHGDKKIHKFLPSILKIAEDGQAIYEFIQNAVDCNSSQFFIFYNDKYFLAVNNGTPFTQKDVLSILNIADTTKDYNCDNIGRFGIGFKLVHRLVGKDEGIKELIEEYKGPVIFSWNEIDELKQFLGKAPVFPDFVKNPTDMDSSKTPWLFKIIATNFPTEPGERVLDIHYKEKILFPYSELKEIIEFVKENFKKHQGFDFDNLQQGSLFFIKLGEGKKDLLDNDYKGLESGVQYSMNFLKNLKEVYINDKSLKKRDLEIKEFVIPKGSEIFNEINPEYANCDIRFSLGYTDYKRAKGIRKSPNFYKYFPMGDETNGFSFIIHCDSFDIEANRRKLHDSNKNRKLFPEISKFIIQYADELKENNFDEYLNLYSNFLISRIPNRENNKWLQPIFFNFILNYIRTNIPTQNGYSDNAQYVKIRRVKTKLNLSDFGLGHINWFVWDSDEDSLLIEEAKKTEKLGLKEWDIRDIVENANLESINNWIKTCDNETYEAFLKELEDSYLRKETKEKIRQIKLFKFSDGKYYSPNEIISKTYNYVKKTYKYKYKSKIVFFLNKKTINIKQELLKLGFVVSEKSIDDFPEIFSSITIPDDKEVFGLIAEKSKTNTLLPQEKQKLFLNFLNEETKFDNVGDTTLKELHLFCDTNGNIKPLSKLIGKIETPIWLNPYKIREDDYFSELDKFLISDNESVFKEIFLSNKDKIIPELTETNEIIKLIDLYKENQKSFFKEFIIKKEGNSFKIEEKTIDTHQVQSSDKEVRKFIVGNCSNNLFVLPYEFLEYKNEEGIIKADELHNLILRFVEVNEHKETLIDIIKYYSAKRNFLQKHSEFRFNSEKKYTNEDYEYKILDLACNELNSKDDIENFRSKVIIETDDGQELKLTDIPPVTDKIKIDKYELSLAKILPDSYQNSDYLSDLLNQFITLGLNKERISKFFGISEEPEPNEIFQMFSEQVDTLENAEQLAFLFLYGFHIEKIDFHQFKALNIEGEEVDLGYDKYLTPFNFIQKSEILHQKYIGITQIFKDFPIVIEDNDNLLLIKEPYFENNKFICPYIKEDLTDEQKISFLDFLFNQWNKDDNKIVIKNIDWSKICDEETKSILGFNPTISVFPNEYACENEKLPEYLINWIDDDKEKIDFLTVLGVWTENTIIVELRKFFIGDSNEFQNSKIAQETRFNEDETTLFNTFEWLKEKEIELKTPEQFATFKKVVEVINDNINGGDLVIQEEFDFEELEKNSIEWDETYYNNWKETSDITIFLYNGKLPKTISLDEMDDYIFYQFNKGNIAFDDNNNIFVNQNVDIKKELRKLELENDNFDFDGLWHNKLEVLEKENERLRQQIARPGEAIMGVGNNTDISKNDQKEANREAKEIVKEKLKSEGFVFTKEIEEYSTIDGVMKDDIEYPLVVKSYIYQDEPLKIGANEWIQLMKPNSMFWVHFGNRKLGVLKLYDLLQKQDKITISFSTENLNVEDRLEKFAELLRYFKNIHFDFDSFLKLNDYNIADNLNDYRFDERNIEKDLSADSDKNL